MSKRETIEGKATQMLEPICSDNGVEIYDVEYVNEAGEWYLRAYIDKEGGVTIDDCEAVSRAFSDKLDEDEMIQEVATQSTETNSLGLAQMLYEQMKRNYDL